MLWLKALGGLTMASGDGLVTGALTQRRRLALMALLGVTRDRGMSRDKIVAYLWSESDAERARHALNQLLHAQRKQFAPENLILGGKTLQLNPALPGRDRPPRGGASGPRGGRCGQSIHGDSVAPLGACA